MGFYKIFQVELRVLNNTWKFNSQFCLDWNSLLLYFDLEDCLRSVRLNVILWIDIGFESRKDVNTWTLGFGTVLLPFSHSLLVFLSSVAGELLLIEKILRKTIDFYWKFKGFDYVTEGSFIGT